MLSAMTVQLIPARPSSHAVSRLPCMQRAGLVRDHRNAPSRLVGQVDRGQGGSDSRGRTARRHCSGCEPLAPSGRAASPASPIRAAHGAVLLPDRVGLGHQSRGEVRPPAAAARAQLPHALDAPRQGSPRWAGAPARTSHAVASDTPRVAEPAEPPSRRVTSVTPIAAATPMSGAPRTRSVRMASAMSATGSARGRPLRREAWSDRGCEWSPTRSRRSD